MFKPSYDLREITSDIVGWADGVFPERDPEGTINKLIEELNELMDNPMDGWEIADVLILIFDLCDMLGYDPAKLIQNKMRVNRKRKWQVKDGVMKHVEPDAADRLTKGPRGETMDHSGDV